MGSVLSTLLFPKVRQPTPVATDDNQPICYPLLDAAMTHGPPNPAATLRPCGPVCKCSLHIMVKTCVPCVAQILIRGSKTQPPSGLPSCRRRHCPHPYSSWGLFIHPRYSKANFVVASTSIQKVSSSMLEYRCYTRNQGHHLSCVSSGRTTTFTGKSCCICPYRSRKQRMMSHCYRQSHHSNT